MPIEHTPVAIVDGREPAPRDTPTFAELFRDIVDVGAVIQGKTEVIELVVSTSWQRATC